MGITLLDFVWIAAARAFAALLSGEREAAGSSFVKLWDAISSGNSWNHPRSHTRRILRPQELGSYALSLCSKPLAVLVA